VNLTRRRRRTQARCNLRRCRRCRRLPRALGRYFHPHCRRQRRRRPPPPRQRRQRLQRRLLPRRPRPRVASRITSRRRSKKNRNAYLRCVHCRRCLDLCCWLRWDDDFVLGGKGTRCCNTLRAPCPPAWSEKTRLAGEVCLGVGACAGAWPPVSSLMCIFSVSRSCVVC